MTVYIHVEDQTVHILQRAEGPGVVGEARCRVTPGLRFYGWTFEELAAIGNGKHEIEPKPAE